MLSALSELTRPSLLSLKKSPHFSSTINTHHLTHLSTMSAPVKTYDLADLTIVAASPEQARVGRQNTYRPSSPMQIRSRPAPSAELHVS